MAGRRTVSTALKLGTTHLPTSVPSVESFSVNVGRNRYSSNIRTPNGKECFTAEPVLGGTPAAAERIRWDAGTVCSDVFVEDGLSRGTVREQQSGCLQTRPPWRRFFCCMSPATTSLMASTMSDYYPSRNRSPWEYHVKHQHSQSEAYRVTAFKEALQHGPDFLSFLPVGSAPDKQAETAGILLGEDENEMQWDGESTPLSSATIEMDDTRGVYVESYGCQMNSSDTEVVLGILSAAGFRVLREEKPENARVVLINTCAIRDGAEEKIWHRLRFLRHIRRRWGKSDEHGAVFEHSLSSSLPPPMVVVLGCMAERLKEKLLEERNLVDVVCGPDAYRDLPRLLQQVRVCESV